MPTDWIDWFSVNRSLKSRIERAHSGALEHLRVYFLLRTLGQCALRGLVMLLIALSPTWSLAQHGNIVDRLPVLMTMEVRLQGEEMRIQRALSCDLRRRLHPGDVTSIDPGLKMRDVWEQNIDRISHKLGSGEVLIVVLPRVCSPFNKWLIPLRHDYLPITYWIDSAKLPMEAEEILHYRYFLENPRRRLEVLSFALAETKETRGQSPEADFFADLFQSRLADSGGKFIGLSVVAFPRSIWRKYAGLAAELERIQVTGPVSRSIVRATASPLLGACQSEAQGIGPAEKCLTGPLDTRPYIIGAELEEGVWRPRYEMVGARRYRRSDAGPGADHLACRSGGSQCVAIEPTYRFEIDGKIFEQPAETGGFFLDVSRQSLLRVSLGVVRSSMGERRKK